MKRKAVSTLLAICLAIQLPLTALAAGEAAQPGEQTALVSEIAEQAAPAATPAGRAATAQSEAAAEPAPATEPPQDAPTPAPVEPTPEPQPTDPPAVTLAPIVTAAPTETPAPTAMPTATPAPAATPTAAPTPTPAATAPTASQAPVAEPGNLETSRPALAAADATVVGSGSCGENLTWTEYSDGTLAIEGEGEMENYYNGGDIHPWSYQIVNVQIMDGVTSIGNSAFVYCGNLTSIILPDSMQFIGVSAFAMCDGLMSITLPDSVTSIGGSAFSGCSGLTSITLPDGVTSIGDFAFNECSGLTSITLPDGVTSIGGSAFSGCSGLTSITLPDGVTSIGDFAFSGCSGLTSITLPDGVTIIGNFAFSGCSGLTSINIPNGVTRICGGAFKYCSSLTSINIPGGVTGIEDETFHDCSSLTSINIPDGVTSIGNSVFSGCSSLTGITFPDSVISIGNASFSGCSSLTSINIPDGVSSVGDDVFSGCSSLISINIPDGVSRIGDDVFYGCSSLTSINIPDGVTSIGDYAFAECSGLTSIPIPDSVTTIGFCAFSNCSGLTRIQIPDGVKSIEESTFSNCSGLVSITLPDSVTNIGFRAFYNCNSLTSITLPDGVTSIGDSAFSGCSDLTSINIPDGVTSIGWSAFSGCSGLTSINIPDGVTSIGWSAFSGCSGLTSISIPDGVTSIDDSTFQDCSGLTSINIPDGVTSIGDDAFRQCNGLTSIMVPDSVTSIGDSVFSGCSGLSSITLPDGVTSIGDSVFSGCSGLSSITLPDSVTSIGDSVFYGCSSLTSITLSESMTSIGERFFYRCSGLTGIAIPEGVTNIDYAAFYGCSGLISITIPDGVTSIADDAFCGCSSLTSITIPDSLTSIGNSVFWGCSSLTNIAIPEGVTNIGNYAFRRCSALSSVTLPDSVTSIGSSAFYDCSDLSTVYYDGGKADWNDIEINSSGNSDLTAATIHYYSTGPDDIPQQRVAAYRAGVVESVSASQVRIDGVDYPIASGSYVSPLVNGNRVVYRLDESGQITQCQTLQQANAQLTSWDSTNQMFTANFQNGLVTGTQYLFCGPSVTDSAILDNPQNLAGQTCTVYYVSIGFQQNLLVGASVVTQVVGTLQNFDVLGGQVYLDTASDAYPVNMEDEDLQIQLADLFGRQVILTLQYGTVTAVIAYDDAYEVNVNLRNQNGEYQWSDGGFTQNETSVRVQIDTSVDPAYANAADWSNSLVRITGIEATLSENDYLEVAEQLDLEGGNELLVGDSVPYYIRLQLKDAANETEPPLTDTVILTVKVTYEKTGAPVTITKNLRLTVHNLDEEQRLEEEEQRREEELEQEKEDAAQDASGSAFKKISDKIALPAELNTYLSDDQMEALKIIILSEISLVNAPEEVWTDKLSNEVVERTLSKFLGYKKPSLTATASDVPVSVVIETERHGRVRVDCDCQLTQVSLDGNQFAMFGAVSFTVKLLDQKGSVAPYIPDGIISRCDIQSFAEGVWSVASAELETGFDKVWGDDADKIANNLMEAGVKKLADAAAPYFFQLPVEKILQQFYERELKDKFSSTMFQILCAPSKTVKAHCPVDLLVYDADNTLVAAIENDTITLESENVGLWLEGDTKCVQLFDDSYTIAYRPTGEGAMDVEIVEAANAASVLRTVWLHEVPLQSGLLYANTVDETIEPEVQTYTLTSNWGDAIEPDAIEYPAAPELPDAITSPTYEIADGCLYLPAATTAETLLTELTGADIRITSAGGEALAGKDPVGTGATLAQGEGEAELVVVLGGDIDGNGQIDTSDLLEMRRSLLEMIELEGAPLQAATVVSGADQPNTSDLLQLRRVLVGLADSMFPTPAPEPPAEGSAA